MYCGNIGLEAPYQLGKVERHGDMWKKIASKIIETKNISGFDDMRMVAAEVDAVVNEMRRTKGFSPAQMHYRTTTETFSRRTRMRRDSWPSWQLGRAL